MDSVTAININGIRYLQCSQRKKTEKRHGIYPANIISLQVPENEFLIKSRSTLQVNDVLNSIKRNKSENVSK